MVVPENAASRADALRRDADAFAARGDVNSAKKLYHLLIEQGAYSEWAYFSLGRLSQNDGKNIEALEFFARSIDLNPSFFWAHYECLNIAANSGWVDDELHCRLVNVAKTVEGEIPENFSEVHTENVEAAATSLWDADFRCEAVQLLEWISVSPHLSNLSLVRIIEESKRDDLISPSIDRLMDQGTGKFEVYSFRILINHMRKTDNKSNELMLLREFWKNFPNNFSAFLGLGTFLSKNGDMEELEELRSKENIFPPIQRSFSELAFLVNQEKFSDACQCIISHARLYDEVPMHLAIRTAYGLADVSSTKKLNQIISLLSAWHEDDDEVWMLKINTSIRQLDWRGAFGLFKEKFEGRSELPLNVRLIHIDLLAHAGSLDQALKKLEEEKIEGSFPPRLLQVAIRLMGEDHNWNGVVDTGISMIPQASSFDHFFAPVVRAARKSGRLHELHAALTSSSLGKAQRAALEAVTEELVLHHSGDLEGLLGSLDLSPRRKARLRLLRPQVSLSPRRWAVFYCVDRGYMIPGLTSLVSAISTNISIIHEIDFYLLAEDEIVSQVRGFANSIESFFNQSIKVIPASEVVTDTSQLRETYGIFTGGQSLSLAAYYRIFLARHLVKEYEYDRLLYLDADTLVHRGIFELLDMEMTSPAMARHEVDRPEINVAKRVNNIKGPYFNSGVMMFDGHHPDLASALDVAIRTSIDPNSTLIFQDQCALNISFDQNADPLPKQFNSFVTPSSGPEGLQKSVIDHYLDRPKPWDSLYRRNSKDWLEAFAFLRCICGETLPLPGSSAAE